MPYPTVERPHPQIGLAARERRDVKVSERGMKRRQPLAVVYQHSFFLSPQKDAPGLETKHRGQTAIRSIGGANLAEGVAVKGQQPLARRRDE